MSWQSWAEQHDWITWIHHAAVSLVIQAMVAIAWGWWAGAFVTTWTYYILEAQQERYRIQKETGESLTDLTFRGWAPWRWKFDSIMDVAVPLVVTVVVTWWRS